MKVHDDYFDCVTRCMMTFQYIEEAIKMVLIRLEFLIHNRIKEFTPYDLNPRFSSIQNASMGRLIEMLKIYCDDDSFIRELRTIKEERDKVAHKSLVMTLEEINDSQSNVHKTSDLVKMNSDGQILFQKLLARIASLDETLNKLSENQSA